MGTQYYYAGTEYYCEGVTEGHQLCAVLVSLSSYSCCYSC